MLSVNLIVVPSLCDSAGLEIDLDLEKRSFNEFWTVPEEVSYLSPSNPCWWVLTVCNMASHCLLADRHQTDGLKSSRAKPFGAARPQWRWWEGGGALIAPQGIMEVSWLQLALFVSVVYKKKTCVVKDQKHHRRTQDEDGQRRTAAHVW